MRRAASGRNDTATSDVAIEAPFAKARVPHPPVPLECVTATAPRTARCMDAQQRDVAGRIQGGVETAGRHAHGALLAHARAVVPLDTLRARAAARVLCGILAPTGNDEPATHLHDAFVRELLSWFKSDFFAWVNSPPCCQCRGSTSARGMSPPTEAELAGLAQRVESYACDAGCGAAETRFPRYNDPGTLLRTRRGRCGEWANCFTLVARACGLTARYVLDFSDHVWTEVWAPHLGRWVHADSCEAAYDSPLLYGACAYLPRIVTPPPCAHIALLVLPLQSRAGARS